MKSKIDHIKYERSSETEQQSEPKGFFRRSREQMSNTNENQKPKKKPTTIKFIVNDPNSLNYFQGGSEKRR